MSEQIRIDCPGYQILADLHEGSRKDSAILILPGYTSTKKDQKDFALAMVRMTGYSALVVDYSGHGESPFELKNTRPAQHLLEVVYSYDWLINKYKNVEVNVIGTSYGGFLGSHLSCYRNINKLVLRAPAIYKPKELYTTWSQRLLDEESYAKKITKYRQNANELQKNPMLFDSTHFTNNVIVVVHENDEIVPTETTNAYTKAFNATSYIAENFSHSTTYSPVSDEQRTIYREYIANWLLEE